MNTRPDHSAAFKVVKKYLSLEVHFIKNNPFLNTSISTLIIIIRLYIFVETYKNNAAKSFTFKNFSLDAIVSTYHIPTYTRYVV